jgi:hypothetical protein
MVGQESRGSGGVLGGWWYGTKYCHFSIIYKYYTRADLTRQSFPTSPNPTEASSQTVVMSVASVRLVIT